MRLPPVAVELLPVSRHFNASCRGYRSTGGGNYSDAKGTHGVIQNLGSMSANSEVLYQRAEAVACGGAGSRVCPVGTKRPNAWRLSRRQFEPILTKHSVLAGELAEDQH